MLKLWELKTCDPSVVLELTGKLGIHAVAAAVLAGRGIVSPELGQDFLNPSLASMPDPYLLKGVPEAVDRLCQARSNRDSVCIYGDYDVDGISGTALLVSFLRWVGLTCSYFIPSRFDDGYGLNQNALQQIIDGGATLIVTVDCGITSVSEAEFCRRSGIDLIIVDHHSPKETLPDACAVVNPLQPDCPYPFNSLAGVGVAFNLLIALRSRLRQAGVFRKDPEPDLRQWLDLVALGTIADVVPLIGQNRIYAHYGLKQLTASSRPGIEALKRVAGITGEVSCGQVGFRLAPRLNAAGRIESAVPGVELLLGSDPLNSNAIAEELDAANAERQAIERSMLEEAIAMVEGDGGYPARRSIVLASAAWHQGVVGIVASRLVERYHRPTILIALDEDGHGKGSGRSIPGFHLLEALDASSEHLERFGGHRYAAGVSLVAGRLSAFATAFEAAAQMMLAGAELLPTLVLDAEVHPDDINPGLVDDLKRLEPFGAGNPEPTLLLRGVTVVERRTVGEGHLKLRLKAGGRILDAIAFRQADSDTDGLRDVAFFPELNVWNNTTTLQLRIKDIRLTEAP